MIRQPSKHEIARFGDLPSVKDVSKMAGFIMCMADEMGKLRKGRHVDNLRVFTTKKADSIANAEDVDFQRLTETYTGSVSRRGPRRNREWSMKVAERFWAAEYSRDDDAYPEYKGGSSSRTTYHFKWNSEFVLQSLKTTQTIIEGESDYEREETEAALDSIVFCPNLLHAVVEAESVSLADFNYLFRDIRNFADNSSDGLVAIK